jgi:UDP-N-acetylmuramoyl-tripeptide--D-alanyl-D-alanine ligase
VISLDAQQAGLALGLGPLARPVVGVSIDSRSLHPGDLFLALRGERFDGHDFVDAAFAAGASGAVVEHVAWARRLGGRGRSLGRGDAGNAVASAANGSDRPVYQVEDSLEALGALAREVRRKSGVTVFAITGSVGKTSTKDLLKAMVGRVQRVVATANNQNNEVGVPLSLLAVEPDTQAVVVEMGMRGRGQITDLARVAEPDVGLVTNVHPVHLELLGTLESIAAAKAELVAAVKPGGTAVVPADCVPLDPHVAEVACRVVRFGVGSKAPGADVQGWLEGGQAEDRQSWVLRWPGGQTRIETPYLPRHTLENAVAAAAACYAAGLPVEKSAAGISDVEFTGGRGGVVRLGGLCIIDDTYNASPAAVRVAVDDLIRRASRQQGRAVAVIGDMLELGSQSEKFHEEIGAYAASAGVRALWGVGPRARATVEGFERWWRANEGDEADWSAGHVDSSEETSPVVAGLRPGDVVLFKASRNVRLENMVGRVVDEAAAGRWGSGAYLGDHESGGSREKRQC